MNSSEGVRPGRERRAISEVVGTVILVGVVMAGVTLVAILLLSSPPPEKVPSTSTTRAGIPSPQDSTGSLWITWTRQRASPS